MKTIYIKKEDLDEDNFYKEDGIGTYNEPENVSVEIDENLGCVRFKEGVYVNGSIKCKAGSGITAGEGIEAGSGITAGEGIEAGWGIVSLLGHIKASLAIKFDSRCTLSAGIFSFSGEREIEAQEIIGGKVIYGKVKILPKEEPKQEGLTPVASLGEVIEINGKKYRRVE